MPRQFPAHQFETVNFADDEIFQTITGYWHSKLIDEDIPQLLEDIEFTQQWLQRNPTFKETNPDRYDAIQLFLQEAGWITLPAHGTAEQTLPLFQKGLMVLFNLQKHHEISTEGYNLPQLSLGERLRERLVNITLFKDRDAFKKQLVDALLQNEEVVTQAEFFRDIKQVPGTLRNWFAQYIEHMGSDELIQRRFDLFFEKNENAKKITAEEKANLQVVFRAYHQLKISSTKQDGIEEEVDIDNGEGKTGSIIYGKVSLDDENLKRQLDSFMKTYKTLAEEKGLRDSAYLYDLVEARPGVAGVTAKTSPTFSTTTTTGPDIAATKGPDHFVDSDATEIAQFAAETEQLRTATKQVNYQSLAQDIMHQTALSFKTPQDEQKFASLIESVLRGLRDTIELKQYLMDLSFPSADCDAVVAAVQQHITPRAKARSMASVATKLAAKPTMSQLQKAPKKPVEKNVAVAADQIEPPVLSDETKQGPKVFLPKLRRARAAKRPLVDDVRLQPSMVMGPIDELRAMDPLEFRRLSPDPVQAASRLHDKITLLADESIAKESEGIDAFKQSPLNKLYLELGNQSISSGQPVAQVIAERQAKGTPTLSEVEFNAVADLNKQLRF